MASAYDQLKKAKLLDRKGRQKTSRRAKPTPKPFANLPAPGGAQPFQQAKRQAARRAKVPAPKPKKRYEPTTKAPHTTAGLMRSSAQWNAAMGRKGFAGRGPFTMYGPPGSVERANFEGYMRRRLWPAFRRELGLPNDTPMPKFGFEDMEDALAKVRASGKPGEREVRFSHITPAMADLRPSRLHQATRQSAEARSVPLHEWAHVYQAKGDLDDATIRRLLSLSGRDRAAELRRLRLLAEGGAEAFSRDLARKIRVGDIGSSYPRAERRVRRRYGPRFIRKGQFR